MVAVLLGWWLLDEPLGGRTVLAGVVIAGAVALIVLPGRPAGPGRPELRRNRRDSIFRLRERAPIGEHRCSSDRSGRQ
ncbi:hypothetical protein [Actinoplanes auranticolor]|uniref:hypothetical protein n=1 Tax=Actinoplanes auranticolor TaxID=47988 RepID=UPI001BB37EA1|nr:hypothetical protein [Actinoplanes auranticolor]